METSDLDPNDPTAALVVLDPGAATPIVATIDLGGSLAPFTPSADGSKVYLP